jgi:preprotein translocase subunit SecE
LQGTHRYVLFAYLALGLIAWITISKVIAGLVFVAGLPDPSLVGAFTVSSLIGLLSGVGLTAFLARHPKVNAFSGDVFGELNKVTWPSRKETQSATVVVIVTTIVLAVLLGFMDLVWAKLTGLIYTA